MKRNKLLPSVELIVDANGSGDFSDLQEALDFIATIKPIPLNAVIHLKKGVYKGQFYFDSCPLTIIGEGMNRSIITGNHYAYEKFSEYARTTAESTIVKRGTFRSYTAFFGGSEITLENLTIENTSGLEPPLGVGLGAGQAVALYADASHVVCRHVRLSSFQDTLFISPLPQAEREKGGFTGPRMNYPRLMTQQFYEKCEISGTVDFIFGGGNALFSNCKIIVRKESSDRSCFIAAPCADNPTQAGYSGFIFNHCKIKVEKREQKKNEQNSNIYLARPWRPYAKCVFNKCHLSKLIAKERFHIWNNENDLNTAVFSIM